MSLSNKTALVTGGAQGIGLAISEMLLRKGAAVAIADLNHEKAQQAVASLQNAGPPLMALKMDVADKNSIAGGVSQVVNSMGPIDILINNAGVYLSTPLDDPKSSDAWRVCLDVMLTGSYEVAKAVIPGMKESGWGRIINLGSLMSFLAFGEDTAYCAAKSGMLGLTRSLSVELAKYNICVNTVCPGNILTDMLKNTAKAIEARDGLEPDSWLKQRGKDIPLGRLGEPEDVANAIGFFCSREADYITGQTLHVNGGQFFW